MRQKRTQTARAAFAAGVGALALASAPAWASSHREAPFITSVPKVDATDLYMFRSYESGRENFVTIIANYYPFQDPFGGPNYYPLDPDALYEIHVDNNGDAKEDITFQFRFEQQTRNTMLNVGGKQVAIPLKQSGQITGFNDETQNVFEFFRVNVVRGDRRSERQAVTKVGNGGVGDASTFQKPLDNIGGKTFPNGYQNYANNFVYGVNVPGCPTPGRMFVGQRKDPFAIPVGNVFDLINLNPLGAPNAEADDLAKKNVTTLALELPISCLTAGNDPVIGAWTTASLRQGRLLSGSPAEGLDTVTVDGGAWTQVSRLGMPLVNEVVVGLKDKNRFNASEPSGDTQFIDYVTNPTLPALIQTLFPSATAPTKFPRQDLVVAFLTGVDGLNKPQNVTPSEMLRLNTSTPAVPAASQNRLGVLANDAAGFPNGRRPGDDVVDIELRVAMGVLCTLNNPAAFGCVPGDAPAGAAELTDGVLVQATQFDNAFPYLRPPLGGSEVNTTAAP